MNPLLAESWAVSQDGLAIAVKLRPHVRFHDGSPADAASIAQMLPGALKKFMGPMFSEVTEVKVDGASSVLITFRRRSPLLAESLEAPLEKPGSGSTGAYKVAPASKNELIANDDYYLGAPTIKRVQVETFPTIRAAWAEMLRDKLDVLYEVGPDALASMERSNAVSLFTFTRRYQYVIILNPRTPAFRSAAVRRALSLGIDRGAIVQTALNGYGVVSSGPVWPRYWAFDSGLAKFGFEPAAAAQMLGKGVRFECLMPPDSPFERIALEVKRQLAMIGAEMTPREVSFNELSERGSKGDYEAMLIEVISGPTLFRPYLIWQSNGPFNWGRFGTSTSDAALAQVRDAQSDDDYRRAVSNLHRTFMDDPPAIFLAWSQRARAVSKRFSVPTAEPGREIMSTLRLWKPTADARQQASRN